MVAQVIAVRHRYFDVTTRAGAFEIHDVPVGAHTVRTRHELYGSLTSSVKVGAGTIAEVDFTYSGQEKPAGS
jgi:hypothetical protein